FSQGDGRAALPYWQGALTMCESLFPKEEYRLGHPELANSLDNLGVLLQSLGEYKEALSYHQRALTMREGLYPKSRYPHGHPALAIVLMNLAGLFSAQGDHARAFSYGKQALAMTRQHAEDFLALASETEAFNFVSTIPVARDGCLSVSRTLPGTDDEMYMYVWQGKAIIPGALEQRGRAVRQVASPSAVTDPAKREQIQKVQEELVATRRGLSQLLLAPAGSDAERAKYL